MKLPATVTRLMMKRHDSQQYRGEFIQERIYGSFLHCCSAAVPILSASTLHTLIFALASAPLAAASVNFYRRVSNDGTPRITVAIYPAAHPASYAQLTMAFEENQRLPSKTVPVGKWLKNWGTAGAHGLTKRFCQLLSPTKRAAHAAVRIQAAVRGHQRRNLTKRAAVRIQAAVRGHQCRAAVSVHV